MSYSDFFFFLNKPLLTSNNVSSSVYVSKLIVILKTKAFKKTLNPSLSFSLFTWLHQWLISEGNERNFKKTYTGSCDVTIVEFIGTCKYALPYFPFTTSEAKRDY